jgi:predicted  nucleic acid-binding Zn-ribbon protein
MARTARAYIDDAISSLRSSIDDLETEKEEVELELSTAMKDIAKLEARIEDLEVQLEKAEFPE